MSPNVGNFVHDLVEMAKAMETLPQVQDELDRTKAQLETTRQAVQDRELAIIHYKSEIDDLHAKVRSLEVERDDASFRVLEAEDKAHHVLNWARDTQALMGQVISELDPPKPEPVKEPEPQELTASGWNPNIEPLHAQPDRTGLEYDKATDAYYPETPLANTPAEGQSAVSPTTSSDNTSMVAGEASSSVPEPTHGPYFGKFYRDVAGYVNIHDWITGGGTEANYYANRSDY